MDLQVIKAGKMEYSLCLRLQEDLLAARQAGTIPDTLILVEHPPVITLGRAADPSNIKVSRKQLKAMGVEIHETNRGGDVTYHGSGQLVGYPIIHLKEYGKDVHAYYSSLEQVIINLLDDYNIRGRRDPLYPGVWVGNKKVAAIGVAVKGWVTMHGFALNIYPDPFYQGLIIPCGIASRGITTLQESTGRKIEREKVLGELVASFAQVFALKPWFKEVADCETH